MPKELFTYQNYEEHKKHMDGPLKFLKSIEVSHSHTTIAYLIMPTTQNPKHICDDCKKTARFLVYDRDHMAQTAINLYCEDHAHPAFKDWVNEME